MASLPHRPFCIPSLPCASVRRRDPFCKVFQIREQAPTIASSCKNIAQSRVFSANSKASFSPFPMLNSRLEELHSSICPNLVIIMTEFMAPNEIYESKDIFTGTCFDPTLVVTSAYAVGRIFAIPNPNGVSPLYKAFMGRICGFSTSGSSMPVKLTLLAVSFSSDVAVLKVEEGSSPMHVFPLAAGPEPEIDSILISESYWYDQVSIANVLAVRRKSIRAKAPWPLDDQAAWIEMSLHQEPPPVTSLFFESREKNISGSISMRGSPWFNLDGDLVGVASWVVTYNSASFSVGYAAPVSVIRHVVDYAKAKGPHDPVVMDRWINMRCQ
ncbi:hypothetical protein C2S51_001516 [Perilla frutescens var. frutescens]|nr:hypothetical protein C2S51_001516 [Perilla frutescens var. frutescens]